MARVIIRTKEFEEAVEDLVKRAKNSRAPLKAWGQHMVGSVKRNFQEQGRPDPWRPLKVNTLIARFVRGKAPAEKSGGKFAPNPNVFKQDRGRLTGSGTLGDSDNVSTVPGMARSSRTGRVLRNRSGGLNKFAAPGMVFRRPALRAILSGKILLDTGRLRSSVSAAVISGQEVQIGTNVIYAGPHQFGWPEKGIPARPFLVIHPDDEEEFVSLLTDWLAGRWGS